MPAGEENKDKPITRFEVVEENTEGNVENLVKVGQTAEVSQPIPQMPVNIEVAERKGGWVVWLVVAFVVGIAVGMGGGFLMWRNDTAGQNSEPSAESNTAKPVISETPSVTPVPVVEADREKLSVKILNGSGVRGAASAIKAKLEIIGYKDIQTGNADKDTYEDTEIAVKSGQTAVADLVKKDLDGLTKVAQEVSEVAQSETFDVLIILGKN